MRSGGYVHTFRPHRLLIVAALFVVMALFVACGDDDDDGGSSTSGDGGAASSASGGTPTSEDGQSEPATIRVQLDWTPNTNHIGIYLAQAKGWYEEENLDVEILPFVDTNPDTVVANGNADIGISFPANVIYSRAAGLDLVSVASVLQSNPTELAVLESSDIQSPKDFDGKTYAGFGLPYEVPQIQTVVRGDGGTGDFDAAILNTAAYEALYNGDADFTEIFTTWEGIEARIRGIDLRTFRYDDYGMPDFPGVVLVASGDSLSGEKADALRRFLAVTKRAYEYTAAQPDTAAQEFMDALPDTFPEPDLVTFSTQELEPYYVNDGGHWGIQDGGDWDAYAAWFVDQGLVVDGDDNVITDVAELGQLFSNELLTEG
jgi:ABC-type nitrate/sulfonate/bicarbonate transport system substrate-binding protein